MLVALLATKFALLFVTASAWVASRTIVAVLSRTREVAADRTAVAVTGSPAELAGALRTLDDQISETPEDDLREAAGVSSLSILPTDPIRTEPVGLGPEGTTKPMLWSIRKPIRETKQRLFRTHPPTEERLDRLAELESETARQAPSDEAAAR